jgi:hypothetical protein
MYGIPVRRYARSFNTGLLTGSVLLKGSSVPFLLAELRPMTWQLGPGALVSGCVIVGVHMDMTYSG